MDAEWPVATEIVLDPPTGVKIQHHPTPEGENPAREYTSQAWLRRSELVERADRQISSLRIKARSPFSLANQLSGGNQQKVVIGKWLEIAPNVVLLDDPTRGVDVGAKREIYLLIRQLSAEGRIVLFNSTELPELIGLCDRILVMYRGRLAGALEGSAINEHDLLHIINTGEAVAAVNN